MVLKNSLARDFMTRASLGLAGPGLESDLEQPAKRKTARQDEMTARMTSDVAGQRLWFLIAMGKRFRNGRAASIRKDGQSSGNGHRQRRAGTLRSSVTLPSPLR